MELPVMRGRFLIIAVVATMLVAGGALRALAQAPGTDNPLETYTWRYEKSVEQGQEVVKRMKMTWDEGDAWDKEKLQELQQQAAQGQIPGAPPGADPVAIATWKLFYDQLVMWDEYLKQTALAEVDLPANVEDVQWVPPGMEEEQGGRRQTGAEAVVAANQDQTLDEQAGQFFSLGGAPEEGAVLVTRADVLEQVLSLYELYKGQGKKADEVTYTKAQDITTGLSEREGRRLAYRNWLDDRKDMVVETAMEWGKRQQGQVVVVDGVEYELYSPTQGLPQGAGPTDVVRVVTDNLTPYDLLNPDGTQKKPSSR
jgi:hypothetical protein